MKYALFIAELHPESERHKDSQSFVAYAKQDTNTLKNVSRLNDGTYLCNLSDGLNALGVLVGRAKEFHIQCRTLFFDQEPSWIYDKT